MSYIPLDCTDYPQYQRVSPLEIVTGNVALN